MNEREHDAFYQLGAVLIGVGLGLIAWSILTMLVLA